MKNNLGISNVGVYGCGVMGCNLALNLSNNFVVSVYDRESKVIDAAIERSQNEKYRNIINGFYDVKSFVNSIKCPRCIIILIIAGKAIDNVLDILKTLLDEDDIIIDGGNEWWLNSVRREKELKDQKINYIDMGISGGEKGAQYGASIMVGGNKNIYKRIEPILQSLAAKSKLGSCISLLGPIGCGNYIKMVHNGIEYANMQLIAEIYNLLKIVGKYSNDELVGIFDEWNNTEELNGFLMEITSIIFNKADDINPDNKLIDFISDKAEMKGTGCWTIQEGAERACPIPTLAAALNARYYSAHKNERILMGNNLKCHNININTTYNRLQILNITKNALYFALICVYSQGFSLIKTTSDQLNWNISLAECARIWTNGCIIRSSLLYKIYDAFLENSNLQNLMLYDKFTKNLNNNINYLRQLVIIYINHGIPCDSLASTLNYYDTYRQEKLPSNLIQAQRDFFGSHTYERTDIDGKFHTIW